MQIKSILAAAALVVVASTSFASTGTAAFVDGVADFSNPANFTGTGSFSDTITFSGLAAGKYDISLDFSGQSMFLTDLMVNGLHANSIINVTSGKNKFSFAYLDNAATSPFTLSIFGNGIAGKIGSYSGSFSASAVAPVPEPETYAMMLAGLVGIGFMASRRKRQDI